MRKTWLALVRFRPLEPQRSEIRMMRMWESWRKEVMDCWRCLRGMVPSTRVQGRLRSFRASSIRSRVEVQEEKMMLGWLLVK